MRRSRICGLEFCHELLAFRFREPLNQGENFRRFHFVLLEQRREGSEDELILRIVPGR